MATATASGNGSSVYRQTADWRSRFCTNAKVYRIPVSGQGMADRILAYLSPSTGWPVGLRSS